MHDLSLEEIEFVKILAKSDATLIEKGMNFATLQMLHDKIGSILREYYKEKTMNLKPDVMEKFSKAGISEDDGKAAIACARRLGIDIS